MLGAPLAGVGRVDGDDCVVVLRGHRHQAGTESSGGHVGDQPPEPAPAGARGYVLKAGPPEELFQAVRAAVAGGIGLASEVVGDLVGRVINPSPGVTERERQVVRLMADGHSNRAIAQSLYLSEATVKTHLVRIYRKLGVDNRAAAVSEAVRRGLLDLT